MLAFSRTASFIHSATGAYRLPILSGILIGTSYIPSYPLAVFWSFVPLWLYWMKNFQPRKVFLAGWITQFLLTLIGFHWVAYTAHEFGHLPWPLSVIVLLAFCCFANLHVPLAGWLWSLARNRWGMKNLQASFLLASLTVLGEIFFPMIFPWHHGYVWLWAGWQGFQFADLIGMQGLSAVCIFSNVFFLWLWTEKKAWRPRVLGAAGFLIVFLAFNFLGGKYGRRWSETDRETRFLAVQANIGNLMKYFAQQGSSGATKTISETYFQLTGRAVEREGPADFILWPETAYPEYLSPDFYRHRYNIRLREFVRSLGIPLITGGYRHDMKDGKTYNSIFFVESTGNILQPPYSKTILLAFGEYFPGAQYFPFLKEVVPAISDFARGTGPRAFEFYGLRFGPQICYEGLYPDFSRQLADNGAEIFINVTNDSWFGRYFEPYQHLYMTLGRAIEFRRPLVRTTNTGYTTAILADGTVLERSPLHEEWVKNFTIRHKTNPPQTFFSRYGARLDYFFVVLTAAILLWIIRDHKRTRSTGSPS